MFENVHGFFLAHNGVVQDSGLLLLQFYGLKDAKITKYKHTYYIMLFEIIYFYFYIIFRP